MDKDRDIDISMEEYDYDLPPGLEPATAGERAHYQLGLDRRVHEVTTLMAYLQSDEAARLFHTRSRGQGQRQGQGQHGGEGEGEGEGVRFHLVGHSFGAGTMAAVACRQQQEQQQQGWSSTRNRNRGRVASCVLCECAKISCHHWLAQLISVCIDWLDFSFVVTLFIPMSIIFLSVSLCLCVSVSLPSGLLALPSTRLRPLLRAGSHALSLRVLGALVLHRLPGSCPPRAAADLAPRSQRHLYRECACYVL